MTILNMRYSSVPEMGMHYKDYKLNFFMILHLYHTLHWLDVHFNKKKTIWSFDRLRPWNKLKKNTAQKLIHSLFLNAPHCFIYSSYFHWYQDWPREPKVSRHSCASGAAGLIRGPEWLVRFSIRKNKDSRQTCKNISTTGQELSNDDISSMYKKHQ